MLMEVPECFVGGFFSAGGDQFSPENRHNNNSGEPFAIDDLLDFSNADAMIMSDGFFDNAASAAAGNSTDSSTVTAVDSCNSSVSGGHHHQFSSSSSGYPQLSAELCVPQYEDLAELEWLSNFVEDSSFSVEDDLKTLHILSGTAAAATKPQTPDSSSSSETIPPFTDISAAGRSNGPVFHPETPLPGKARSKRSRAAPGDWSTRLLNIVPEPARVNPVTTVTKKRESSKSNDNNINNNNSEFCSGRKCLHCASEKTPQWRTGPMGPKTLCNACGVRYKSGRLVPEYRPAASPTFVSSRHSNSHRKVMEMRRQKEMQRQQQQHHQSMLVSQQSSIFGDEFLISRSNNGPDYRHLI